MFFLEVLQEDKRGLGMLLLDVSMVEDNHLKHLLLKEEAEESNYEPSIKEEPLICDEPKSIEDAKVSHLKL